MFAVVFLLSFLFFASEAQWGWQNPSMVPFGGGFNQFNSRFPFGGGGSGFPFNPSFGPGNFAPLDGVDFFRLAMGMDPSFGPMAGPGGFNGALQGAFRGAMIGGMTGMMGKK
ncbi:hypothetical protein QR680_005330 [Steinernema hermaphroditum]|uniref:Glycine-rich protein n=1 Tax=Steinernema hermaphroditum TaxID=289476 RepID=A0AA39HTU2_9BILA|nr:hypothetical protein QR680_005330 [Steinernema hermaphroditum]